MVVDSAPVLNEPVVPEPPPAGEVQEVLLVDDQFMFVFALYAIEGDDAETDTEGAAGPAEDATVTVVLWLAAPPAPTHVTVKVVGVVSAPVLNVPVVPEPPPAGEVQEVLLVDDQVMAVLALFMMEFDAAVRDMAGGGADAEAAPALSAL